MAVNLRFIAVVDRLERLTNLVALLLNTQRPLTLDEIVMRIEGYPKETETRRQAFERDKRLLRDEGVPVETLYVDEGKAAYRIAADDYYLLPLDLSDDELVALNLAVAAVHLEGGRGREAMWSFGDAPADAVPALAALPVIDALPALFDGVRRRAAVSFAYRGHPRTLEPWGLFFRDGNWYVAGRDVDRGEERVFRADRIQGAVTVGASGAFTPPAKFDPQQAMPDQAYRMAAGEPTLVDVAIDAPYARTAVADAGEDSVIERRDDGGVTLRIAVTNPDGFRSWLFGFLDHAEVVGPPATRTQIMKWLEAMAK
jgi:predicted DNA-binding transcriptional regulator YafY